MEKMNYEQLTRTRRARRALADYLFEGASTATAIQDLITDLHHLAAKEKIAIEPLLATARSHYNEEIRDDECKRCDAKDDEFLDMLKTSTVRG
jgi:hypothetical protein